MTDTIVSTSVPIVQDSSMDMIRESTRQSKCLVDPTRFRYKDSDFEYSVYAPSTRFLRELSTVFPRMTLDQRKEVLAIPIIQRCEHDMVAISQEVNDERDAKLEIFVDWGKRVVNRLRSVGMWADIMDPASGYPIFEAPGASPFPDVQGIHDLTRYHIQNIGCCHILLHPFWGSKIYPTTMFTTAPIDVLCKVMEELTKFV